MKKVTIKQVDNRYMLYKKHLLLTSIYVTNSYEYLLEEIKKYFGER